MSAPHQAVIEQLRRQVAELGDRVTQLERQHQGSRPRVDAVWIRTIAAAARGSAFSAGELSAHAMVDGDLRAAIQGMTTKQIGKRLRRLADHPHGDLIVCRIGRDAAGALWSVQVREDLHDGSGVGAGADV